MIDRKTYCFDIHHTISIKFLNDTCEIGPCCLSEHVKLDYNHSHKINQHEFLVGLRQENLDKKTTELEQELMYIPVASQIKEKFGGLRFYVNGGNQRVWDILSTIEDLSYHVCEECGTMKNVRTYTCGWHKTLCNEHADAKYGQSEAESFRNDKEEYDI